LNLEPTKGFLVAGIGAMIGQLEIWTSWWISAIWEG